MTDSAYKKPDRGNKALCCLTKDISLGENNNKILLLACLIIFAVAVVFLPCLKNDFVNFDDDIYVINNPSIRDLSLAGIKQIFSPATYISEDFLYPQLYTPLVTLSYAFEYQFFELDPFIYHFTNLLLHLGNCLLIFLFIFLLSGDIAVAFIVSIMFGIHPLRVESVVWVTERKDVLQTFFFLSALVFYVYYKRNKRRSSLIFIYCLFILALLSKPTGMIFPIILVLIDYFMEGKITLSHFTGKVPFFVIAVVFSLVSGIFTKYLLLDPAFNFFDYILIPFYCLMFFLNKILIPTNLSCIYPYPLKNGNFLPFAFLISPPLTVLIGLVVVFSKKYTKKLIFGFLFFVIASLPYLRIVPFVAPTLVADHYTYLASVGIFFVFAELFVFLWKVKIKNIRILRWLFILFCLAITILLSISTWNRCKVWKNSLSLWNDVIDKYPDQYIPIAYFNRGILEMDAREDKNALSDFSHVLMLYSKRLDFNYEPIEISSSILEDDKECQDLYNLIAVRFADINKYLEAEFILTELLRLFPNSIETMSNLGSLYANRNANRQDLDKAICLWQKVLDIKPDEETIKQNINILKTIRGY